MAVSMSLHYDGDLRCTLTHDPSSSTIRTDAPTDNAGKGELFSPTDLLGAALMSCAVTIMGIKAPKARIPWTRCEGKVTKTMTTEGPRKIAALDVDLRLPSTYDADQRARLEEFARTCPVALSVSSEMAVSFTFHYDDALNT